MSVIRFFFLSFCLVLFKQSTREFSNCIRLLFTLNFAFVQVIRDHGGLSSYNIDHIPAYEIIMMGVHEGTRHREQRDFSPRQDIEEEGALGGDCNFVEAQVDVSAAEECGIGETNKGGREPDAPEAAAHTIGGVEEGVVASVEENAVADDATNVMTSELPDVNVESGEKKKIDTDT